MSSALQIPLSVHDAKIKTIAVQINTITVGRKQVTLSLFRQLREEDLISDDGTLNGIPWGYVNYCPGKDCPRRDHWHIVWQRGNELLRSAVEKKIRFDKYASDVTDRFILGLVYDELIEDRQPRPDWLRRILRDFEYTTSYGIDAYVEVPRELHNLSLALRDAAIAEGRPSKTDWDDEDYDEDEEDEEEAPARRGKARDDRADRARRKCEEIKAKFEVNDNGTLEAAFNKELEDEAERRKRHVDTRKALAALPQLFIAV